MGKISRSTFLKQSSLMAAFAVSPFSINLANRPTTTPSDIAEREGDMLKRMVIANDRNVGMILKALESRQYGGYRRACSRFSILSASYCYHLSGYYQDPALVRYMKMITEYLKDSQNPDGTFDFGNLQSPPDTSFMLEEISPGTYLLMQEKSDILNNLKHDLKIVITSAAKAVAEGGVHTPNHRWVLCAALAHVNEIYPDRKYIDRIHDWLGEGIYQDNDGEYAERSKNYDRVTNRGLIDVGRLLNLPSLYEPVRINLRRAYYHMEPNGELITNNSRRQDQFSTQSIVGSYLFYRYMAIHDNDGEFAAIARLIENMDGFDRSVLNSSLVYFLTNPSLQKELPASSPLPVNYEKVFSDSSLVRIRRGNTATTLFGGNDRPLIIASGRSHIPDFFSFRKGEAVLRHIRLSSRFFSMGYFRSEGLRKEGDKYILYEKWEAPYYHPLPAEHRNEHGDYKLSRSLDDRFWSKMDFEKRPATMKVLETTITLKEDHGRNDLTFQVHGPDNVAVTIELCFREGGRLSGVTGSEDRDDNYFLEQEMGNYQYGDDIIHFGPGTMAHRNIRRLEGERYSTHNGSLRTEGMHVYLTGITPFEYKLQLY